MRKHKESGRVAATHVFLERSAASPFKFTVTLNARRILPEKTQGVWGVGTTRIFFGKHKELAGSVMRDIKIYSQNEAQAQFIWYTQGSVAD